jgi:NAD-dependent DNA ligase
MCADINMTESPRKTKKVGQHLLTVAQLEALLLKASADYYNSGDESLTDAEFDELQELLRQRHPTSKVLAQVGSPVIEQHSKVKLPYWMGSIDKIKPDTRALSQWFTQYTGPYLISAKLDGLSGLLMFKMTDAGAVTPNIAQSTLYTRGDGTEGHNISKLLPYLQHIPSSSAHMRMIWKDNMHTATDTIAVRGEIIIKLATYTAKYADKYPKARSLVTGVAISSIKAAGKSFNPTIAADLEFIAYEIISESGAATINLAQQFDLLEQLGFTTPVHSILTASSDGGDFALPCPPMTGDNMECSPRTASVTLSTMLTQYKKATLYEIDGLVVTDTSKKHKRNASGNPKYAVAFKMATDAQTCHTTVTDIEWTPSKYGLLKPVVVFTPVIIGGDTITRASGFNAAFIETQRIGRGSKIVVIKSGDVIPYIQSVTEPSAEPLMPPTDKYPWKWNKSHSEAVLLDASADPHVLTKQIVQFMTATGIPHINEGVVSKLIKSAELNTLKKILNAPVTAFTNVKGISGAAVRQYIHAVTDKPLQLATLMDASNCFKGFGIKKLRLLLTHIPNIMKHYTISSSPDENEDKAELQEQIEIINGMGTISAATLLKQLPLFATWLSEHSMLAIEYPSTSISSSKSGTTAQHYPQSSGAMGVRSHPQLKDVKIVFSGFRNTKLENWITQQGGNISTSISSKTTMLLVNSEDSSSTKTTVANKLGIPIVTLAAFNTKFNVPTLQ